MTFDKNIDISINEQIQVNKNIFDKIPYNKTLYFLGYLSDLRQVTDDELFSCQVGANRNPGLLWDDPKSLSLINALKDPFQSMFLSKYMIDAASFFCLLWYFIYKINEIKTYVAVLNPGTDYWVNKRKDGIESASKREQTFFPQITKSVFPYIEKYLENISGQQIHPDKRNELLIKIEDNNFLPPKDVLPYFPFWEEIKSEEYVYSMIQNEIKYEGEKFINVEFLRVRNPRLQALELLGNPELCPKCGDNSWDFVSLSSNNKAAKWKCNFCNSVLLLQADRLKQTENLSGSKRKPISKSVQREVWQRDKGRCVECGSQERLEFDHIIPVSKGGADTARNLQLLCENCNRRKSGKAPGFH